ncbi:hypothetical protein [Candidatus Nitrospira salsa]
MICGVAFVQYEHIDPPFSEAKIHDPRNITLLCGTCHDRVTRGMWSKKRVLQSRKSPITFKNGFARDAFDFCDPFELFVGNSHFQDVRCIVRNSSGEEWFTIEPPEASEAPPRISAKFYGLSGNLDLEIIRNEWRCSTNIWDIKIQGSSIEVYCKPKQTTLKLEAKPPHGLKIQYLNMTLQGTGIVVENDGSTRIFVNRSELKMSSTQVINADAIFRLP